MKKVRLKVTLKHSRGDIVKGSVYEWDEQRKLYIHYDKNGIPVSSVGAAMISLQPNLFEYIND